VDILGQGELYRVLTKEVSADAFERLTQRLLRESGFVKVEVTGRTGDGGIDDKGLFITTGTFTPAAIKEATRDGAPPIRMGIERLKSNFTMRAETN
jgi:restriction system protein